MAIQSYMNESGVQLWKAYVNVRSKNNPALRAQRKLSSLKTQKDAEREEARLLRECERELYEQESKGQSWGAVVESWEQSMAQDHADSLNETTRGDYVSCLKKHTHAWWNRPAASITKADVREVLNGMKAHSSSVSYQNTAKVVINRLFVYGIESGLIKGMDRSPAYGISLGRIEQKKPEILNNAEIQTLLKAARNMNHPWYEIWALALVTGMRSGELHALTWKDVDWENQMLSVNKSYHCRRRIVKSTKSGECRSVPISSELFGLLKEIRAKAGNRTHVLPRQWKWDKGLQAKELRKFCVGLGLPSIKFHTLRACFSTQLIRNGVPPIQIQKVCGWKDLETMQRYIRLAGIEINGVTESLKVLPEPAVMAQAMPLFPKEAVSVT